MGTGLRDIIERIHGSGRRFVLIVTGGGSGVIPELLRVPGGSRTLLEASVPYSLPALEELLGHPTGHACSIETAADMAALALARARELAGRDAAAVGMGITTSLVSDRPKRGDHRCHIAVADGVMTEVVSIRLQKGSRVRAEEEDLVAQAAIYCLARACGVSAPELDSLLSPEDGVTSEAITSSSPIARLLAGGLERVSVAPDGQALTEAPVPMAVLAGSFNPLHAGHAGLARVAGELLGSPVAFEISLINVDKPPLSELELRLRLGQFAWRATVELTRAARFEEKARLLPGAIFVVGADTAARIVGAAYYGQSESRMAEALGQIAAHGCHFLVAGRLDASGRFRTLADIPIPSPFSGLFREIPQSRFRCDLSSTEIRPDRPR